MNVPSHDGVWLVLADSRSAKLLKCGLSPSGQSHVEQHEQIVDDWEGHEHGRPSPRAGKTGHTYASNHHDVEEGNLRFARQLCRWLETVIRDHEINCLELHAPSRCIGTLRKACPKALCDRLVLKEGSLMKLTTDELHHHPVVLQLIGLKARS